MNFQKIIEQWNYKCPDCGADLSVTDKECFNCKLDFGKHITSEARKQFKKLIEMLPIPVVYWKIWEAFYVMLIYLLANLITNSIQIKYKGLESEKYFLLTILLTFANSLILFAAAWFIAIIKYKQKPSVLGIKFKEKIYFSCFHGLKFAIIFVFFNTMALKHIFATGSVFPNNYSILPLLLYSNSSKTLLLSLIIFGGIIPFVEEVFFRGFFYKALRVKFRFFQASILSSIVFGILHIEPAMIPFGIISGIVLCYLYEKYQTIWRGYFLHSAVNVFFILFTFNNGGYIKNIDFQLLILLFLAVSLLFFLVNAIFSKSFSRKKIFINGYNKFISFFSIFLCVILVFLNTPLILENKSFMTYKTFLLINQSQFKAAEEIIDSAIKKYSGDIELAIIKQSIYYYDGNHKKAYETGKKILTEFSESEKKDNESLYLSVVNSTALSSIEINENYADYFEILKKHLDNSKQVSPDILESLGWIYVQENNLKAGEELIYKFLRERQSYTELELCEVYYHLGVLNLKRKDYAASGIYFKKSAGFGKNNYFSKKSLELLQKTNRNSI
ncbi:MAG TPA: type II CAAX endopeptidase family protein [bacterium]|nr:type II CAAX endopeptidase family protein [bacterium]HPN30356.1 type II CAAX endopeptidase family protein [bacterium]